ncbi:MAG: hypothetical protein EKK37_07855 [Sphingobacteriales bacterium]|nr:MAG: hypothetical protein EKK37_07855 [Sphingobacteriales bacterium]
MELKTLCKWITIIGVLLIWTVKWAVRPWFHFNPVITFLLGVAPNLLGAMLLPIGANWLLEKYIDLRNVVFMRWFCIFCFLLLVINEYLQLIPVFGRTFDYYDILASAVGLYFSYWVMMKYFFSGSYSQKAE